ncbi:MAG: methionyl-tRNA formyltransferase [Pseudomonadota bacterium]
MGLRLGFAGTPEFAATILRYLLAAGYRPELVLTQPDRPAGRGRKLTASPVKALALDEGLHVAQPVSLRPEDTVDTLGLAELDVLIVAAYGLILPQAVLDAPRAGCLNVHASLLPRWRGAAPIPWAIASGDAQSGVCLMQMEAGLDTGPVHASQATPIESRETANELHNRLAQLGGDLLVQELAPILGGEREAVAQDDALATYARKLSRDDGRIEWQWPAEEIDRRIRAFNPYPGCVATLGDDPLKLWRSRLATDFDADGAPPGTVLSVDDSGMYVAAGQGVVCVTEVQRPGRGRITPEALSRQQALAGERLGDAP